jgi:hypothetical protein
MQAGTTNSNGYRVISLDGKTYRAHRLAYLWMLGSFPCMDIDHIDGIRYNNSWTNLREVSHLDNTQNRRSPNKNSKSGYIGVSPYARSGKWRAQIMIDGKSKALGHFSTPELAHSAYLAAKRELHPFNTL